MVGGRAGYVGGSFHRVREFSMKGAPDFRAFKKKNDQSLYKKGFSTESKE